MDGTLTHTGAIDFAAMRRRCCVPAGVDILTHVEAQTEPLKSEYYAIVEEEERLGLARMRLRPECKALFDELKRRGIRRGLITRNNDAAMKQTLVLLEDEEAFEVMLSRSFTPPKPHPAPLLHIAERWGVDPAEMAMVGDSLDDVACGVSAGALAVLIGEAGDKTFEEARPHAHATIRDLTQLLAVIDGLRLNHHEEEAAAADAGGRDGSAAGTGVVLPPPVAEAETAGEDAAAALVQQASA